MAEGILSFILLSIVTIYELKNKSTGLFIWVSLFFFFGLGHLFYSFDNGMYEARVISDASYFTIAFCMFYISTRIAVRSSKSFKLSLTDKGIDSAVSVRTQMPFEDRFVEICFCLLLIATIIYIFNLMKYSGSWRNVSKANVYGLRYSSALILLINYSWSAGVPCFLWYWIKKKNLKALISASCIVLMSLFSGTRTHLVALFVMLLLLYLFREKNIKFSSLVLVLIVGGLGVIAMMMLRGFRYYYSLADLGSISFSDVWQKSMNLLSNKSGDFFFCEFFYELISIQNNFENLGHGSGYLRLLLLPFPSRVCLGLKPEDICLTLGRFFGGGLSTNYSVTPTLLGDCFANFGMFGCMLGILWAFIVHLFDWIANRKNLTLRVFFSTAIAWAYINIGRGSVYNAVAGIYYTLIIYGIIYFITRHIAISKIKIRFKSDRSICFDAVRRRRSELKG